MSKKTRDHPSETERIVKWAMLQCLLVFCLLGVAYFAGLSQGNEVVIMLGALMTTISAVLHVLWKPAKMPKLKVFSSKFWELAGMFFDRKLRMRMYDPSIDEIREDFLLARTLCRSRREHAWLQLCFAKRGAFAFLRCLSISLLKPLVRLVPTWLKHWWNLFS